MVSLSNRTCIFPKKETMSAMAANAQSSYIENLHSIQPGARGGLGCGPLDMYGGWVSGTLRCQSVIVACGCLCGGASN